MEKIEIFSNPLFGEIRTLEENGNILFCGSDVAKALGYAKPQNAISAHCKGALKRGIGVETGIRADGTPSVQNIEMLFIPEGDVYRLAAKSELPGADKFERWIFDEVLPAIRATGTYSALTDEIYSYPPKCTSAGEVAKVMTATDRVMVAQKSEGWKRAAQAEKLLRHFGIPVIDSFVEQPMTQLTFEMVTTVKLLPSTVQ